MSSGLVQILSLLNQHDVEYILVGGMAAVLHGAPVTTQDIDIVHRKTPQNIEKILKLLKQLDARYRGQPKGRVLFPTAEALNGSGHNNLMTNMGPLDLLCELAVGQDYEQLFPFTETMTGNETSIQIISLKKLIEIKAETNRAKDRLMLPLLMKLDKE